MSSVDVTIKGVESIQDALLQIRDSILREGVEALDVSVERIKNDAKEKAPIGTPETTGIADYIISASYQKSIRKTALEMTYNKAKIRRGVTAGGWIINPNTGRPVDYAIPLEFGRSNQAPARPEGAVLGYALHSNSRFFFDMMVRAVRKGIMVA